MRKIVRNGKYGNAVTLPPEMKTKFPRGTQVEWAFDESKGRWYLMTSDEFVEMVSKAVQAQDREPMPMG